MLEVFRIPFMQQALLAGLLVAVTCAFLGVFVVLKRIVFVGIALAQLSSAGVALALLLGLSAGLYPTLFSLLFMSVGIFLFSVTTRRIPQESLIGIGYAGAAALGILLVARSAAGESHMLNLLFGNILAATPKDILLLVAAFGLVGLLHFFFHKEFIFVSFDAEMASALGLKARLWDLLLYLSIGVTIAVAIKVAGALLVFALLVIPATGALLAARRLRGVFLLSGGLAVIPVVAGLWLAFVWDLPPAATIVMLAFGLLLLALLAGKIRGR